MSLGMIDLGREWAQRWHDMTLYEILWDDIWQIDWNRRFEDPNLMTDAWPEPFPHILKLRAWKIRKTFVGHVEKGKRYPGPSSTWHRQAGEDLVEAQKAAQQTEALRVSSELTPTLAIHSRPKNPQKRCRKIKQPRPRYRKIRKRCGSWMFLGASDCE